MANTISRRRIEDKCAEEKKRRHTQKEIDRKGEREGDREFLTNESSPPIQKGGVCIRFVACAKPPTKEYVEESHVQLAAERNDSASQFQQSEKVKEGVKKDERADEI